MTTYRDNASGDFMRVSTNNPTKVKFIVDSSKGVVVLEAEDIDALIEHLSKWADDNYYYSVNT